MSQHDTHAVAQFMRECMDAYCAYHPLDIQTGLLYIRMSLAFMRFKSSVMLHLSQTPPSACVRTPSRAPANLSCTPNVSGQVCVHAGATERLIQQAAARTFMYLYKQKWRTPDGAEEDEEDEEEPHRQPQAHESPVVILHAVPHVAHEVKLGSCRHHCCF